MLPAKTFLTTDCLLYESNFDVSGVLKLHRVMEFLQDAAGAHAANLGFGWDNLDATGCLWVLSKLKIRFDTPIGKDVKRFTLYTWPLKPTRFFAERCFVAVNEAGEQLFCATSVWLVIDRDTRRIVSPDRLEALCNCDYDDAHCDVLPQFERVRRDEKYEFCYDRTIRRSDLDVNGHANNTNYVNYALDALSTDEIVSEMEIVYQKELVLGDVVHIYGKRDGDYAYVVGERGETCFTVKFTLAPSSKRAPAEQ